MSSIKAHSLQYKLFIYGIVPSLCLNAVITTPLNAEDLQQKKSLVILEGRQQPASEGMNLQQKVQFLTALNSEQSEKLRVLRQEIQNLKKKLHLSQLATFSEETGNYKQLYTALKQESAQNKEKQKQLQEAIAQWKNDYEKENQKNNESESHIISLITALEAHAFTLEKIEEGYRQELANRSALDNETFQYKLLYSALEQELTNYKETQNHLEKLIQQLKQENENEKQLTQMAENYITTLLAALSDQTHSIEIIQKNHQTQLEQMAALSDTSSYETKQIALEQELAKAREAQNQLQQLIEQMQIEKEVEKQKINDAHLHMSALMNALEYQTLSIESIKNVHKKELEKLSPSATELQNYQQLNAFLERELAQTKEAQQQLEWLIQDLIEENELSKQKIANHETDQEDLLRKTQALTTSIEKIKNDALSMMNTQLSSLYDALEAEKGIAILIAPPAGQAEKIEFLFEALDGAHLEYKLALQQTQAEQAEKMQQLLANLNEEKIQTASIRKNLDEAQQIYEQTVKLYNELYIDHKTAQKQLESIQKELDEKKINHLVETDALENKIENLAMEFKIQSDLADELQIQLAETRLAEGELKKLQNEHFQLTQDVNAFKDAYIHDIEDLSLHEDLYKQALAEIGNHQKALDEQQKILQKAHQDNQTLTIQLKNITLTPEEIQSLQANHEHLQQELNALRETHLNHVQTHAWKEDFFANAQKDLEKYRLSAEEQEKTIQQLLQDKEVQTLVLAQKNEEVKNLKELMDQTNERIKNQFQEFASNLEAEKNRNAELLDQLNNHHTLYQSSQENIQNINLELEKLKNHLTAKEENSLLQKIENEDLNDRLAQSNEEKSKLLLQLEILEEKQLEPFKNFQEKYEQEINDHLEKYKIAEAEKQSLLQEVNELKKQLVVHRETNTSSENQSKVMAMQLERLQEALQQMINEKTAIQSQYQSQLVNEKILSEKLEETLAELEFLKQKNETERVKGEV